jgi:hypothetical protein
MSYSVGIFCDLHESLPLSVSTLLAPLPEGVTLVLLSPCQGVFAPAALRVSGASFYPAMPSDL